MARVVAVVELLAWNENFCGRRDVKDLRKAPFRFLHAFLSSIRRDGNAYFCSALAEFQGHS